MQWLQPTSRSDYKVSIYRMIREQPAWRSCWITRLDSDTDPDLDLPRPLDHPVLVWRCAFKRHFCGGHHDVDAAIHVDRSTGMHFPTFDMNHWTKVFLSSLDCIVCTSNNQGSSEQNRGPVEASCRDRRGGRPERPEETPCREANGQNVQGYAELTQRESGWRERLRVDYSAP